MALILVATKVDKVGAAARKPTMAKVKEQVGGGVGVIGFSSVSGDGREELWSRIRHAVL
jgi:GTP-binding protein EngB required for normal cell division